MYFIITGKVDNASTSNGGHPDSVSTASAGPGGHGVWGGTPVVEGMTPSGVPASGVQTTVGEHSTPHHPTKFMTTHILLLLKKI